MNKQFTLLQLVPVTDGRLTNMDHVYDVLNHVCDQGEALMTHHLPVAYDYLKLKAPKWREEATAQLNAILALCPTKERNQEQFIWLLHYLETKDNPVYDVPQLKDEFDTSDFGDYMVNNSLLLKRK